MSVTAPPGFRAAGLAAGIKASGRADLAVVLNDGPAAATAGVFTANRVCAAPVTWTRQVVSGGRVRAVVLNSGCANACTGPPGLADTTATARRLAAAVSAPAEQVAVCSTGLIGERLPMDKLLPGVDAAAASATADGGAAAAAAIMTTDTVPKTCCLPGPGYLIGGMAKGAAMLAPGLAAGITAAGHPLVREVRGTGLWLAIVLDRPAAAAAEAAARQAGFLVNAVQPDAIRLAPPLILSGGQADSFTAALPAILDAAAEAEAA